MVFDGFGPLVKRCDGFDGSLWSNDDHDDYDDHLNYDDHIDYYDHPDHPDHPDQARAADPRGQLLAVSSHQGVLRGDHDQVLNSWHHLIQVGNCNMMTKIFIYIILIFSQSQQSINKVSQVSKSGS